MWKYGKRILLGCLVLLMCICFSNSFLVFAVLEDPSTSDVDAGGGTQHSNWSFYNDDRDYTLRFSLVELKNSSGKELKDDNQLWTSDGSKVEFRFKDNVNAFVTNAVWGFSREAYNLYTTTEAKATDGIFLFNNGKFVSVQNHLLSYNDIVNAVNNYNSDQGVEFRATKFDAAGFSKMSVLESHFRALSEALVDVGAMEAVIDVFKSNGLAVPASMTGKNTCLVIEPVAVFTPDSTSGIAKGKVYKCFTYRTAIKYESTQDGVYAATGIAPGYNVNWRNHHPHNISNDPNLICTHIYEGSSNCTSGHRTHSALPGHLWQETLLGISTNATELSEVAGCFIICRNLEDAGDETVAADINITYDGSLEDKDKRFEVYSETTKEAGDDFSYWQDDWKEAKSDDKKVGVDESKLDDFVLKKAYAYDFSVKNKNVATVMSLDATVEEFEDDSHKSKLSIKWEEQDLKSHDKNFGKVLNVKTIKYDGQTGLNAIRDAILQEMADSDTDNLSCPKQQDLYTTKDYIDSWSGSKTALAVKLLEEARSYSKPSLGENNEFLKGSHFGVNINVWAKPVPVKSHVIEIDVVGHPDGEPDVTDQSEDLEYSNLEEEEYLPDSQVKVLFVYNNDDIGVEDIPSHIQTIKDGFTGKHSEDEFIAAFKSTAPGNRLYSSDSPSTIGLGSNPDEDAEDKGYTIIVLRVKEEVPTITPSAPTPSSGKVELPDYELNKIYPNVVNNPDAGTNKVTTLKGDTWSYWADSHTTHKCARGTHSKNWWNATCKKSGNGHRDYDIKFTAPFSGNVTAYNDTISVAKAWVLNTTTNWFTLSVLKTGKVLDIDHEGQNRTVTYDLDLIREVSGDTRTLSGMTTIDSGWKTFVTQVLKLTVGNKPTKVVMPSAYRNSKATISGVFKDTMLWKAVFKKTGGVNGNDVNELTDNGNCWYHSCYWCSYWNQHSILYHELNSNAKLSDAFLVNGAASTEFQVDISEVFYKYRTDKKDIGLNEENVDDVLFEKNVAKQGDSTPNKATAKLDVKDICKYVYNKNHDGVTGGDTTKVVLNYYPEVEMRAHKHSGETVGSTSDYISSQTAKPMDGGNFEIMTIGEEMRQSYSSSMYIFRLKKAVAGSDVKGKLWSDGTATGVAADKLSGGLPVIYAGSDITLTADTTFDVLMYGYSLDVIKSGDNLKGTTYNTVVADNSSVYNTWGNSTSQQDLKKAFKTWAEDMTKVDRWAADLELDVSGLAGYTPKQYNNFSASVGKIEKVSGGGKVDVSEKEVYQLEIRKGKVVEDNESFKQFLEQLRKDYDLDTVDQAKEVFYKSGLHTAILNAIEHVESDENTSQADPKGNLGANGHWYDEQVKTIVIRRYEATPMRISNIALQDKVDFGAAPDADSRFSNKDGNMTKAVTGQWFLTLHMQDLPKWMQENHCSEYKAAQRSSTVAQSIDTMTTIIDKIYIDGCDFKIPNGQTTEMN